MNFVKSRSAHHALVLSLALAASAVSHADTVNVIFAAENALYGAGYDVGRADGWMDNSLKKAIRQYQDQVDHLRTSGNLDSETLTSLGIANKAGTSISGNAVAKKADALAALGISDARPRHAAKPKPRREKIVAKAFTVPPAPTPTEQPKAVAVTEKPEPATAPAKPKAKAEATASDRLAENISKPNEVVVVGDRIKTENKNRKLASPDKEESVKAPVIAADVSAAPVPSTPQSTEPEQEPDLSLQLPDEPTAAGIADQVSPDVEVGERKANSESRPSASENNRSVFGSLFDFLFGWMV
ncbi:peptidoglycan-binding protein [Marinobacter sp. M216]|uniref:Peptidoglycan-binding protein n=1 Tax=Marinobacter albus TaxID=3030833 RepID=A0ABT7HC51_9GAMM|nr:peptidoglycan-binding protein [Marinobacter sp. M216]MDK9557939.1 peptidoglycan-binding protein [Marinobacter sp. M216]